MKRFIAAVTTCAFLSSTTLPSLALAAEKKANRLPANVANGETQFELAKKFLSEQIAKGYVFELKKDGKSQKIESGDKIPGAEGSFEVLLSNPKTFSAGLKIGLTMKAGKGPGKTVYSFSAYKDEKYVTGGDVQVSETHSNSTAYAQDQVNVLRAYNNVVADLRDNHNLVVSANSLDVLDAFIPSAHAGGGGCMMFAIGAMFGAILLGGNMMSNPKTKSYGGIVMILGMFGGIGLMMQCGES